MAVEFTFELVKYPTALLFSNPPEAENGNDVIAVVEPVPLELIEIWQVTYTKRPTLV